MSHVVWKHESSVLHIPCYIFRVTGDRFVVQFKLRGLGQFKLNNEPMLLTTLDFTNFWDSFTGIALCASIIPILPKCLRRRGAHLWGAVGGWVGSLVGWLVC